MNGFLLSALAAASLAAGTLGLTSTSNVDVVPPCPRSIERTYDPLPAHDQLRAHPLEIFC